MSWKNIVKSRPYFIRPASIEEGGNEPNPPTKDEILQSLKDKQVKRYLEEIFREFMREKLQ